MKILFLTRAYSEHAGGMERLSYELIQNVSKQSGVEATVIAHHGSRPTSPLFNLSALLKAFRAARQVDVIHLGDPMLSLLGWKLKKLTGKPVAVTVHGLDIAFSNPLYQLYLKLFFKNFDHYLPISRYVASLLKNRNVRGQITVVNPGISDRFYDPAITRERLGKLLNLDVANKKILSTSGRLVKRKGHEWFIREVFPQLPKSIIYAIAGNGPEAAHIAQVTEKSGVAERVILLGKVSNEQLKILYNTVDAFIMPNIPVKNDVEGFGLVLLEAALCNRPVFASNLEGISDAIHNGKNGTLLPAKDTQIWADTLNGFLQLPALSFGSERVRTYALEHFNWDTVAKKYLAELSTAGK